MSERKRPSPERVQQLLSIDPETGIMRWRDVPEVHGKCRGKVAGTKRGDGRPVLTIDRKRQHAGRVAWVLYHGRWPEPGTEIDHIDRDAHNNRPENLREVSRLQNARNKNAFGSVAFKGVSLRPEFSEPKFLARIYTDGESINLGLHPTAEDAARAYDRAALHFQGEFAVLNFPDDAENLAKPFMRLPDTYGAVPFRGVYLEKATGKFRAEIRIKKIRYRLGRFDTAEEAARAYADAASNGPPSPSAPASAAE